MILVFGVYADEIAGLPRITVIVWLLFLAGVQLFTEPAVDWLMEARRVAQLEQKAKYLKRVAGTKSKELSDLRSLIITFLEHSEIYRDKVKDYLRLNEDYLCIVKSSEGLSAIYNAQEEKTQFPFTKVLSNIPDSIRPFENMGLFLIPTKSIPKNKRGSIRKYIDSDIIPRVKRERKKYLDTVPKKIATKADQFSYKYIAFYLRKENVAHGLRNRKFNHMFNSFIVDQQIGSELKNLKADLVKVVKTKEILQLVNWAAFANLNDEQQKLITKYNEKINSAMEDTGIFRLTDLANSAVDNLTGIIWSIARYGRKTTRKKVKNLSEKVIDGARNTIKILRDNGVDL